MAKVYLVGAGPGDPDLITWKGRQVLARADSVLYDALVDLSLLSLAPPAAERLYVGKRRKCHSHTQEEICQLLVERGQRGLTVVRLKGGDPFIFGRGGEEAEALAEAGVPFEVVPGVTAPLGVAAYCGVPLTHREHTSAVTFVTGHHAEQIDWARVGSAETLVIYMGLHALPQIASELIRHGRSPQTPALAVRWATRASQQTVKATLADLPAMAAEAHLQPPAMVIIGEVVRLYGTLNWFERLPLFGQRIVVTRAAAQAGELSSRLRTLGAEAVELPTIEIGPAGDFGPLDAAISQLDQYDWLLFTSANGVRAFADRLDRSPHDLRRLRARLCAIGPATARALGELHLKVDLLPSEYVAESVVDAFANVDLRGKRLLLPRAAVARDVIPHSLSARGAQVEVVEAYRTGVPRNAAEQLEEVFADRPPQWVTFTSSSTVTNFVEMGGLARLPGVRVASIGPVTSATARRLGVAVDVEAEEFVLGGLIDAILNASLAGLRPTPLS